MVFLTGHLIEHPGDLYANKQMIGSELCDKFRRLGAERAFAFATVVNHIVRGVTTVQCN